ncbi:hypothetical protein [Mycetohabitans rhizoxinica]|uniref:hypothetical protein n=1 Tax=Mycetohabitans rhizoxinica TaxID=412963 RepID=UPI0030D3295F
MHNQTIQMYRGYAVQPSAHRLPDGCFSSNVTLERENSPLSSSPLTAVASAATLYSFYSLDYFSSEKEAVRYSNRWAQHWIDMRG